MFANAEATLLRRTVEYLREETSLDEVEQLLVKCVSPTETVGTLRQHLDDAALICHSPLGDVLVPSALAAAHSESLATARSWMLRVIPSQHANVAWRAVAMQENVSDWQSVVPKSGRNRRPNGQHRRRH
jgi:hypothetical protein